MRSPTGKGIRQLDGHGSGAYGAPRGSRKHRGADYICEPGQVVVSPVTGFVMREARPYAGEYYSGCVIVGKHITIKLFYVQLDKDIIGRPITRGDRIGIAQDIGEKHPGITPHVHLEIVAFDPAVLTEFV